MSASARKANPLPMSVKATPGRNAPLGLEGSEFGRQNALPAPFHPLVLGRASRLLPGVVSNFGLVEGLHVGELIAGKYRLVTPLGEGGMGIVWAAEHEVTKRKVALKFLRAKGRARGAHDAALARERALREARASVAVDDVRVLPIDDVVEHDAEAVLVMDRLEGETLRQRIARDGKLPFSVARPFLVAIAEAMVAAHTKGVVHRDLKPDNVFLLARPTAEVPLKILDFGIAKLAAEVLGEGNEAPLTATGAMLGTPVYMSPEQGFGESDVDARSDAWSFGVIAYELLAGERPVRGDNLGQVLKAIAQGSRPKLEDARTDAPRAVCHAVDALLLSDREVRGTLAQFLDALAQPEHALATVPEARGSVASKPARKVWTSLGGILALAAVGAGAAGAVLLRRASSSPSSVEQTTSVTAPTLPPVLPSGPATPSSSAPRLEELPVPTSSAHPSIHAVPLSKPVPSMPSASAPKVDDRGAGGVVVKPPF